jgi:hypothetical protein
MMLAGRSAQLRSAQLYGADHRLDDAGARTSPASWEHSFNGDPITKIEVFQGGEWRDLDALSRTIEGDAQCG